MALNSMYCVDVPLHAASGLFMFKLPPKRGTTRKQKLINKAECGCYSIDQLWLIVLLETGVACTFCCYMLKYAVSRPSVERWRTESGGTYLQLSVRPYGAATADVKCDNMQNFTVTFYSDRSQPYPVCVENALEVTMCSIQIKPANSSASAGKRWNVSVIPGSATCTTLV